MLPRKLVYSLLEFLVLFLKRLEDGLRRKLEDSFIECERKPQERPAVNLGSCLEEAEREEEDKNSCYLTESWSPATQSCVKRGRVASRERVRIPKYRKGFGQHPKKKERRDRTKTF